MIVFGFTLLLFAIAALLQVIAWRRHDGSARRSVKDAWQDFLHMLPRLALGVIGAGFIAKAVPEGVVLQWFGPNTGISGTAAAALAGVVMPGGPVVGFALGAAALKAGAGLPQVVAFVTAWSLFTLNRVLVWEVTTMPKGFVLLRIAVSLPFPFIASGLVSFLA
jgi:uncharacterized membrane protein YraQ (UPF0718 family)